MTAVLSSLANHLWQSTLCVGVAWLLTLALRRNRASARYWIWLAASVKFLVPFSLLVSAGSRLPRPVTPAAAPSRVSLAMQLAGEPFAGLTLTPVAPAAPHSANPVPHILLGVWLCGIARGRCVLGDAAGFAFAPFFARRRRWISRCQSAPAPHANAWSPE